MQPPFHRLHEFASLTAHDRVVASKWAETRRRVARNETIRREGDPVGGVFFLMSGWVGSSVMLRDGRRQIAKVHLPGDMMGFPSLALAAAGETLEAITDVALCVVPNAAIGRLFSDSPRLAASLFLSTQYERVALMQELSWVGAASALERLAAFLIDLHQRLNAAGLVENGRFEFPLTQQYLGDLLGLTSVHVNRTLKRLDDSACVERGRGWIAIRNLGALQALAPNLPPKFGGEAAWLRLGVKTGEQG